jgi:formate dehydrogenase major subunit
MLPGYLPMRTHMDPDLSAYVARNTAASGWWTQFPKYIVSLLKAYFGDAAQASNDWCFGHLPRTSGDHSHMSTVADMADGLVKGYFIMGENPVVGSMNGALHRKGMAKLDWLVVRDFAITETAAFWEERPAEIATEVFFFPAAAHTEKSGSFTNTQRLLQWHDAAIEPPGECRSDLDFVYDLGLLLKDAYKESESARDLPIRDLTWHYADAEAVLSEINGYATADRRPLSRFTELAADGSTAAGCWIYCGAFAGGVNQTARRKPGREQSWVAPEWGWSWPANRRILYNRASADPEGNPWSGRKKYVWWNPEKAAWEGYDTPDFISDRPPGYRPGPAAEGTDTISGIDPFIMNGDGKGRLFVASGLLDGPLPAHYEPLESPIRNLLYRTQSNPARMEWRRGDNIYHRPFHDLKFPYVLTTYRLTEHHAAGAMTRWLSWLAELQPAMFCEVSKALAEEKGLRNGGWATITTARGEIEARVLITDRIRPLRVNDRLIHQIGVPYHWGSKGLVRGDSANELIAFAADPNVSIQESKALTANIREGRRMRT